MGKTPDFVFFLGGHDAEMLEIRDILKCRGIPFFDKGLSWGARLSEYEEEIKALSSDQVPVFIELKFDCDYPEEAIILDHHDERSGRDKPTSLEQLAQLLNIQLNRRQRLIAANDRGHIEAMLELCATEAEVKEIRKLDLEAQGITDKDQRLARESVDNNIEKINHTAAIIDSKTIHTSIIFDMLYDKYRYIFVITPDHKLNYSGDGRMILRLKKEYEQIKGRDEDVEFWYGGNLPEQGYFGANKTIEKEVIKKMVEEIPVNSKIISHHIFMFPFTIKTIKEGQDHDFLNGVTEALKEAAWEKRKFKIETEKTSEGKCNLRYSEYFYFHGFVHDALYYTGNKDPVMEFFERPIGKNAKFIVSLKKSPEYELKLNKLSLHIFDTGVGILSIELFNDKYSSIADLLKINDYGKRIYPQYLDEEKGIDGTKESFLADSITLDLDIDNTPKIIENFPQDEFRKGHRNVARYIRELLGNKFRIHSQDNAEKALYEYRPTIDDRMYAICWYVSDKWSNILKQKDDTGAYCYETSDMWYRFMYHDGGSLTCQHPAMMHELIKKSTYQRWTEYGTFYGITRYSLTSITDTGDFAYKIIRQHMRRQYAQMARLLLAQRASILKFSAEVTEISNDIKRRENQGNLGEITERVEDLYARYIHFVNCLWFTEVTPQEQGIEMYTQAVKVMGLKAEMEDLKTEIKELYEYIGLSYDRKSNEYDRKSNKQTNAMTVLGAVFLPLMVLTGFFGMNLAFIDPGMRGMIEEFIGKDKYPPLVSQILHSSWSWWFISIALFIILYEIARRITIGYFSEMKTQPSIFEYLKFWAPIRYFLKGLFKKRGK